MAKFTSGHMRTVALVLKSEMPDESDPWYEGMEATLAHDLLRWRHMCQAFAIRFAQNNTNFDAAKFYTHCGIESEITLQMVQN